MAILKGTERLNLKNTPFGLKISVGIVNLTCDYALPRVVQRHCVLQSRELVSGIVWPPLQKTGHKDKMKSYLALCSETWLIT